VSTGANRRAGTRALRRRRSSQQTGEGRAPVLGRARRAGVDLRGGLSV